MEAAVAKPVVEEAGTGNCSSIPNLATMRTILLSTACIAAIALHAQDTCSCSLNLERFIGKVERNYAGFRDKVTKETRARYLVLTDSLRAVAASTTDTSLCFGVLETYRAFFLDKHLQLQGTHMVSLGTGTGTEPLKTKLLSARIDSIFADPKHIWHPWEGIWQMDAYEVGVLYMEGYDELWGMIRRSDNPNWQEGMVKFRCYAPAEGRTPLRYWFGDLRMKEVSAELIGHHLIMDGIGIWRRRGPGAIPVEDERAFELEHGPEVQWRMLDDSTLYIKLGSCRLENKAVLDSLVAANMEALDRIPNWIVDFRGNGGGSTDVFKSLLPYLYTKPMKYYGASHWMSPENTALLKAWCAQNRSMLDKRTARLIDAWVRHGEKHPNTWLKDPGGTERHGRGKSMPHRIAILADQGTASSGESFLEVARGTSDKSVIFGENTGGYKDYGDLQNHHLGCDGLVAGIPTSRMNRIDHGIRYDLVGIAPDVRIDAGERDWIAIVRKYWAQPR